MFNVISNGIVDISKLNFAQASFPPSKWTTWNSTTKSYLHKLKRFLHMQILNKLQWGSEYHTPEFQKHLKVDIMCIRFFEWQSNQLFTVTEHWSSFGTCWPKHLKTGAVFRPHLKTSPFDVRTTFTISKIRLVWYSDPHCVMLILE